MTFLKVLWADRRAATGLVIITGLGGLALLAPWVAPADPLGQADVLRTRFLPPFATGPVGVVRWLGTDALGRDLLSRLLYGARISFTVGMLASALAIVLGVAIGATAAVSGGRTERGLMAVTDAALALPRIVLLLALVALFRPSVVLVIAVLGFTGWMPIARLVRGEVKRLMVQPFVEAAVVAGAARIRLLRRHLLPNALTPVIVAAALSVGNAIALEAGLAFLGLGVPAPAPSWGNMIASGRDALVHAPWIATIPGLALVLAIVGFNLIGDGARDALEPGALARARVPDAPPPATTATPDGPES